MIISEAQNISTRFTWETKNYAMQIELTNFNPKQGKRVYTLKKEDTVGAPTLSAHPARFSPDDKFSKERIACKKRFNILPIQVHDCNFLYHQ